MGNSYKIKARRHFRTSTKRLQFGAVQLLNFCLLCPQNTQCSFKFAKGFISYIYDNILLRHYNLISLQTLYDFTFLLNNYCFAYHHGIVCEFANNVTME